MAGREKKTKKLSNASRESPSNTKQPSILSFMSPTSQESGQAMDQEPNTSGTKKAASKLGKAKKISPTTKINTLKGKSKTKANFKLIQTLAQQAVKPVMRRGRPPLKKHIKADNLDKSDESIVEEGMAKKRGRKKGSGLPPAESTEDIKTDGAETKAPATKDTDNKKTAIKNLPKKVVKKKQLLVAQKGLTKRKVLLSKKILKTDAKQVDPKILKKNLTAKLKSVSEKLEAKKIVAEKESPKACTEALELEIPVSEIKKEPGLSDSPSPLIPDSRSSSPRTGTRKRNSADISISKAILSDVPSSPGIKSPYSTRSERSSPLSLASIDQSPKVLRNGRQRKPKGLKNTLLSETVGQEYNRRRRLLSDTKIELSGECLEVENKIKRFRSCSRDGSEISKCSDVTESDLSTCDGASIDIDNKLDGKDDCKLRSKNQPLPVAKIKEERISIDTSPTQVSKGDVAKAEVGSEAGEATSPVGTRNRDSVDNDNNNTDEKIKTDGLICDKLGKQDDSDVSLSEKNAEKSLILDNMSKAINQVLTNKKGNIRRSARQRKSTVKAKEQEETILVEQMQLEIEGDDKVKSEEPSETPEVTSPVLTEPKTDEPTRPTQDVVAELPEAVVAEAVVPEPVVEQPSPKITTKTFYGDPNRLSLENKKSDNSTEKLENSTTQKEDSEKTLDDDSVNIRLHIDEDEEVTNNGPTEAETDDTLKENVEQCSFTSRKSDPQDIGKLIDKLRHFEEQDKKKQEEKEKSLQQSVMVTNDVVLISKNAEQNTMKDLPNSVTVEKAKDKENFINCLENNPALSIIKKDQIFKSLDIDLPSSVTLIKKTTTSSRKHSTSSRDGDNSVTVLDKSLGKDLTMELRKSIDQGILTLESSPSNVKTSTINTGNGQSLSISIKPQAPKDLVMTPGTTASSIPVVSAPTVQTNPVTALISLPTPSPLMITPVPMSNNVPVPISSATVVPKVPEIQTHILTLEPSSNIKEPTLMIDEGVIKPKENIQQTLTVIPKSMTLPPISLPSGISIISAVVSSQPTKMLEIPPMNMDIPEVKQEDAIVDANSSSVVEPKEKVAIPELVKSESPHRDTQTVVPTLVPESPMSQKQKQDVLRAVGLVSLKEANEAKQEKEKQKEITKSKPDGYTGTLKTVIKLNRTGNDKKARSPLKMTLQKNKSRSSKVSTEGLSADSESDESPHYTIHKEIGGVGYGVGSMDHVTSGGHRKTHYSNRFNNHEPNPLDSVADAPSDSGSAKEIPKNLVIPEKASSFGIHPGRLCQDQCFYCGGKFGLYDTPCHVAQIKSTERQKKILDNEEKLTVDSCLCDACYRHVDRRANCPGYRRRVGGGGGILGGPIGAMAPQGGTETEVADGTLCHATMCRKPAPHTLRRKWLVKMRNSVAKVVQLDLDYPGLHTIPLCEMHYQAISHLMVCGLCKGGLSRNHVHYINQEYKSLNPLLAELGLPVVFKEKPAVCKLCRYFCTLLCKPPAPHQANKRNFMKTYKRRLLLAYNIDVPEEEPELEEVIEEAEAALNSDSNKDVSVEGKEKKKSKNGKSKSKKSDVRKSTDENNSRDTCSPTDSTQENKKMDNEHWKDSKHGALEEDIESLISTNTIPIPNSNNNKPLNPSEPPTSRQSEISDNSDLEAMMDVDQASMDKQSEIQMLLQKCNIPSSTILQKGPIANLTQKNRNILKVHNATAISKNIQNQKILDRNARKIQKLGQIITKNTDLEKAICSRLPNREEFTLEAANNEKVGNKDASGISILKNLALNDECTIESLPVKPITKPSIDIGALKSKWQLSNSFTQIKKNLKALSETKKSKPEQGETYSNPVRRLETNPSISVRELFPGEEEMNLQCSIEFGNVKGITPDGWEKCSSTIQYDADTKKLWQELQRPYGNQSSFLRHLILLEKYFRNGDLILAQNANCSAATYSESVQNRLRSYDNIPSGETVHLPLTKPTNPMTITPAEPVAPEPAKSQTSSLIDFRKQKNNSAGKSLLKTNQLPPPMDHLNSFPHMKNPGIVRPIETLLPAAFNHAKIPKNVPISLAQINQSLDPNFSNFGKNDKNPLSGLSHLDKISHLNPMLTKPEFNKPPEIKIPTLPPSINIEAKSVTGKPDGAIIKPKVPSLPPELIAINTDTQRKSIDNVLKNIQQLAKGSSTPVNKPFPPHNKEQTPGLSPIPAGLLGKPIDVPVCTTPTTQHTNTNTNSPQEQQGKKPKAPKQWRPKLIPITDESKSKVAKEILYQTADGRRLPSLVEVISGHKPYYITIEDYNKLCILRREKRQQQAEMAKKLMGPSPPASVYDFTIDPPAIPISSTGSLSSSMKSLSPPPPYPVSTDSSMSITTSASAIKPIEQTIASIPNSISIKASTVAAPLKGLESQLEVTPIAQPELSTASLLKNVGLKNITIAPVATSAIETKSISPPATNVSMNNISLPSIISHLGPSISVTTDSGIRSNSNSGIVASTQLVSCVQPITITSQAVLLPKIPKSLTVIPQSVAQPTQTNQSSQEP